MKYAYGEYDGMNSPRRIPYSTTTRSWISSSNTGTRPLRRSNRLSPADAEILEKLMQEGMLDKVAGRFRLTPRAINAMQRKALMEIFSHLPRGAREGHPTANPGPAPNAWTARRKYQYGDPISELDLNATLRNAVVRAGGNSPTRRHGNAEQRRADTQSKSKNQKSKIPPSACPSNSPSMTWNSTMSRVPPPSPCASSSICPAP